MLDLHGINKAYGDRVLIKATPIEAGQSISACLGGISLILNPDLTDAALRGTVPENTAVTEWLNHHGWLVPAVVEFVMANGQAGARTRSDAVVWRYADNAGGTVVRLREDRRALRTRDLQALRPDQRGGASVVGVATSAVCG